MRIGQMAGRGGPKTGPALCLLHGGDVKGHGPPRRLLQREGRRGDGPREARSLLLLVLPRGCFCRAYVRLSSQDLRTSNIRSPSLRVELTPRRQS